MTSTGDGGGVGPLDPDFADLFRPEDSPPPAPPEPAIPASPAETPEPSSEHAASEPPVPAPDVPAVPVDTGRLFRSQGVSDHPEAVLALSSDHFGRLRTLKRDKGDASAAAAEAIQPAVAASSDEPAPREADDAADMSSAGPVVLDDIADLAAVVDDKVLSDEVQPDEGRRGMKRRRSGGSGRTIGAGAVYLIVIGVTVLVGFANALLAGGSIGWPTGVALLISSVYAALTVRREDDTVAFLTPPVAFFLAALTAGQVFIDSLEGSLLNRAVILFFTLADNWIWIIGATLAALVIVLIRRRSAR